MAQANVRAEITANDRASGVVANFGKNVERANKGVAKSTQSATDRLVAFGAVALSAKFAFNKLTGVIGDTVDAANQAQSAIIGLTSIAEAFEVSVDDATQAAQDLAVDGLMTVSDAATGLKNLLAAGFNLPQAIKLMERFKDSASFGRQSSLSFGRAVVSATEGLKNQNSILVDNAGVTKNLSVILTEAGFSAQDLQRATSDATVRQALFNGIVKETEAQVGDAAKLTETFAGKQAQLSAKTTILKEKIGTALQPALLRLVEAITPIIEKIAVFIEQNPDLSAGILLVTTAAVGLTAALGTLALATGPVTTGFKLMAAGAVKATGGMKALAAFARSPAMLNPWTVLAAVAVGAFVKIQNAAKKTEEALNNTVRASDAAFESDMKAIKRAQELKREGKDKEAEAILASFRSRSGAFQLGGNVTAGRPALVGEGSGNPEMFVPSRSGRIEPIENARGGGTINLNVNIGMFSGTGIERRKIAETILQDLRDLASAKGMTVPEFIGGTRGL